MSNLPRILIVGYAGQVGVELQRIFFDAAEVRPISSAEFVTLAKRPRNSVLSNEKLFTRFGIGLDSWETALDEVILRLAERKSDHTQSREL
jgi:dTDP-4-dehydrorhamnose reductase